MVFRGQSSKADGKRAELLKYSATRLINASWPTLIILGFSLYFLVALILDRGYVLLTEDHLFEYLTALFYLGSALLCLAAIRMTWRLKPRMAKYWLLGWAVFFILVALEEISWGQRILGVETPDFIASRNLQKETNLHNFDSEAVNRLFSSFVFLVGVALPALCTMIPKISTFVGSRGILLPQRELIIPFALAFAFVVPSWFLDAPEEELLLGLVFGWLAVQLTSKLWPRIPAFAGSYAGPLLAGLCGIVLIQLVMSLFEDNLGHRSHPSEVKEFLFSACFLIFSCRMVLSQFSTPAGREAVTGSLGPKGLNRGH